MNIKNIVFIAGYHILLFVLGPLYLLTHQFNWWLLLTALVFYAISGIGITMGYHRLYSHRTFKTDPIIESLLLIFGSMAVQNSVYKWSHDHRIHHTHQDTQKDPYAIQEGFWHAHMGWIFQDEKAPFNPKLVADLAKNKLVMLQDKYYELLILVTHVVLFGVTAFVSKDPLGAFVLVILLRLFLLHHCTFFINSLAHMWGAKTYSRELSAIDNGLIAFLTFGEGYHNFHHTFMTDYRNGIRWYHFDPSKWLIWGLAKLGMADKLRRTDPNVIKKSLIKHDMDLFQKIDELKKSQIYSHLEQIQQSFEKTLGELQTEFNTRKKLLKEHAPKLELKEIKKSIKNKKRELKTYWKSWIFHAKCIEKNYHMPHI